MAGMTVCDKGSLGAALTSRLLSGDTSQSSLVDEAHRRGFRTTEFLLEDLPLGK